MEQVFHNLSDLIIRLAGIVFLTVIAIRVLINFLQDNEVKLWRNIFFAFVASIFIYKGADVIDLFNSTWDKVK